MKRYFAFTLAELLIAMAVVGIIGALTIPNIQKTYQHKEIVAKVNKNVHLLSVAFASMSHENDMDTIFRTATTEISRSNIILNKLYSYTKMPIYCGDSSQGDCFNNKTLTTASGAAFNTFLTPGNTSSNCSTAILADGTNIGLCVNKTNYDTCANRYVTNNLYEQIDQNCYVANIIFDINGISGPQSYGVDVFRAELYNDGSVKLASDIDKQIKEGTLLNSY